MSDAWEKYVEDRLRVGASIPSRSGARHYTLIEFDDQGFRLQRPGTGSSVSITRRKVNSTYQSLRRGPLQFQAKPPQGIDYTVAKEAGVLWALQAVIDVDNESRLFRMRAGLQGALLDVESGGDALDAFPPDGNGDRLRQISHAEFHDHALEIARDRRLIKTVHRRAPFQVSVKDHGHVYTPESTGKDRGHNWGYVDRVLDTYNRELTLETSPYQFTVNASYQLAIINDLLECSAGGSANGDRAVVSPREVSGLLRAPSSPGDGGEERRSGRRHSKNAKLIGDLGERHVMKFLGARCHDEGWERLRHVAAEGEKPGWDIEFEDRQGAHVAVEVKSTVSSSFGAFELTKKELAQARRLKERYWLVLVVGVLTKSPGVEIVRGISQSLEDGSMRVSPTRYRVTMSDD